MYVAAKDGSLTMPQIKIYTAGNCCYCHMAKDLLRSKGAAFEEIDVTGRSDLRSQLREQAGGRSTVPQVWIDEMHVGGCDDLRALDRSGRLDVLLADPSKTG
jgi:glutaredoxin 3